MNAVEETPARWVEAFAEAWRAPADADTLVEHFRPLLAADYRFSQPLMCGVGKGLTEFDERFARPLFTAVSDIRGTVESWAAREDTVFIELTLHAHVGRHHVTLRACDRVVLSDGVAAERHTYFDPLPLLGAVLRTPRLWWPVLRQQTEELIGRRIPWTKH